MIIITERKQYPHRTLRESVFNNPFPGKIDTKDLAGVLIELYEIWSHFSFPAKYSETNVAENLSRYYKIPYKDILEKVVYQVADAAQKKDKQYFASLQAAAK